MENLRKHETPNVDSVPIFLKPSLINCFNYDATNRQTIKKLLYLFDSQIKSNQKETTQ